MIDPSSLGPDRAWFRDVNLWAQHTPWLHGALTFYATRGPGLFALLIVAGFVVARRRRSAAAYAASLWAVVGTLVAVAVNQPIARDVGEPRPFAVFRNALVLVHRSTDPSFASDHATMAGAVAVGLFFVSWRLGVVASVAAVLMAFARVYVGAHFPVDVVAGLALGGLVSALGWLLLRRPLTALVAWLSGTPLGRVVPTA